MELRSTESRGRRGSFRSCRSSPSARSHGDTDTPSGERLALGFMSTEAGSRDRVSSASLYFEMTSSAFARWLSHAGLAPPRELPFLVSVTFALPLYFQWVVGRSVFPVRFCSPQSALCVGAEARGRTIWKAQGVRPRPQAAWPLRRRRRPLLSGRQDRRAALDVPFPVEGRSGSNYAANAGSIIRFDDDVARARSRGAAPI